MKLRSILLTAAATISLATATRAQVPNYLPTNGLVGWWFFNGNANDESVNTNDGTVNGAILTTDRFGSTNSAYSFNGTTNNISVPNIAGTGNSARSIFAWIKTTSTIGKCILGTGGSSANAGEFNLVMGYGPGSTNYPGKIGVMGGNFTTGGHDYYPNSGPSVNDNLWHSVGVTYDGINSLKVYIDGVLVNSTTITYNTTGQINFIGYNNHNGSQWSGLIDDVGIWNRALTQQEITDLYNAVNCANNSTITPQTNFLGIGSTATFTASTSDPNPSFLWQSDFGQGFQTLYNIGNYTGTNTGTLNIANIQLPNHTQPIRVITTSGNCIDTSNVAVINILDTCITNVTVYDTLLTTVTDTLVINALITGINPPNNLNTLKVFPNPANTHITIDYGNFNAMSGYTLTIVNSIGQTVFTTPINQQTSYIDLSTWTGNGIYFVQLIDPQNNTIENKKIVIQ
ncbi:MAG: LamG-like jellyroll fold domain-containing protein [Bacteroidota bacterium]|jgi:hypothetical protein